MTVSSFIQNLNNLSDEEITSWLKEIKANGLTDNETTELTLEMAKSGKILSWEGLEPTIDKHSTGGIGDKITLLFVPLIATYGINIPKLSGRSLGITGGTIDKLESISGLRTNLSIEEIKEQVKKIGLAVGGAGKDLAPADKRLYAIRDVTGTIDSIPLIASSVMSKKIAGGATNIILDVKSGSGAFMKKTKDAKALAKTMVMIGKNLNKKIKALVTSMNEPLGKNVGNSLEITEVLEVLSGKEITDLVEITTTLAKEAVLLVNPKPELNLEEKLRNLLLKGEALKKFNDMVLAQNGNLKKGFKKAGYIEILKSKNDGFIQYIDAQKTGEAVHSLGAGRKAQNDLIDHSVGIVFLKKSGNKVTQNEPMLEIHAKNREDAHKAQDKLLEAIKIGQEAPAKLKLVHEIVR